MSSERTEYYKNRYMQVSRDYKEATSSLRKSREYIEKLEKANKALTIQTEELEEEIKIINRNNLSEQRKSDIVASLIRTKRSASHHPIIDIVITSVCEHYEITMREFMSKSNKREYVLPRQVAHYILAVKFSKYNISLSTIGKKAGDVDHSTVIYSRRKIENYVDVYDDVYRVVQFIYNTAVDRYNEYKSEVIKESHEEA